MVDNVEDESVDVDLNVLVRLSVYSFTFLLSFSSIGEYEDITTSFSCLHL